MKRHGNHTSAGLCIQQTTYTDEKIMWISKMNLKPSIIVEKGIELTNVQEGTEPNRGRLTDATILSNRDVLLTNVSEYDF